MNRFNASPWFPLTVTVVALLIADLVTDSTLMSIVIAAAVGLLAAAVAAVLGRRDTQPGAGCR